MNTINNTTTTPEYFNFGTGVLTGEPKMNEVSIGLNTKLDNFELNGVTKFLLMGNELVSVGMGTGPNIQYNSNLNKFKYTETFETDIVLFPLEEVNIHLKAALGLGFKRQDGVTKMASNHYFGAEVVFNKVGFGVKTNLNKNVTLSASVRF